MLRCPLDQQESEELAFGQARPAQNLPCKGRTEDLSPHRHRLQHVLRGFALFDGQSTLRVERGMVQGLAGSESDLVLGVAHGTRASSKACMSKVSTPQSFPYRSFPPDIAECSPSRPPCMKRAHHKLLLFSFETLLTGYC